VVQRTSRVRLLVIGEHVDILMGVTAAIALMVMIALTFFVKKVEANVPARIESVAPMAVVEPVGTALDWTSA